MATLQMKTSSLLSVFVTFLYIVVVSCQYDFSKIDLPPGVTGPESVEFRGIVPGQDFYTSVTDGRILRWLGSSLGFVDFAYTAPTRNKQLCDGTTDENLGPICGKPMALSFQPLTGLLYIADAYFGLLVVGPLGGPATQLAGGYKFVTGVAVDTIRGDIYFTDGSLTYELRNTTQPNFMPDSTGRLLRYNPITRQVSVLLGGLRGAGGPAVSPDGTFILVPEFGAGRISKYWLTGPKANTAEILISANFGTPDKIKRAARPGEFWVALSVGFRPPTPLITPQGVRFNSDGVVLERVSFSAQFFNKTISVVQEENGRLYVGSRFNNFIGVYTKSN